MNLLNDLAIDLYYTIEYLLWLIIVIYAISIACRILSYILEKSKY